MVTKYNLEQYIDKVAYSYSEETLTLYTNVNGYLIPLSVIPTTKELPDYITPTLSKLDSLGFSRDVIMEGVQRCKRLHGYS